MLRLARFSVIGLVGLLVIPLLLACSAQSTQDQVARGRYLVVTGGCNDCHTPGYAPNNGNVPEDTWLVGDTLGYRGPWGTTYPVNLRLHMQNLTEDQWVEEAKTLRARPPMPWFSVNQYHEEDLRAIYQFITSLGPKGEAAPDYLPPDQEPPPPYIQWPSGP